MKWYRAVYVLVVTIGFALSSPKVFAQLVPAAEIPSAEAAAARPSAKPPDPNPILPYTRPTQEEKLRLFAFDALGPYAFATAASAGAFQQASNSPPEWGGGGSAFGMRVASNLGIQLVTTSTRYGLAEILREDAVYYRCQCRGLLPRFGHALISTVTGRHGKDGRTAFSFSDLVSPCAGTMTALAWYPDRYGVKDGFRMGNYNLLAQAAGNLALEFIYGGPHTLFSHVRRSKSQGGTTVAQNL
jgi:hypothetical protein